MKLRLAHLITLVFALAFSACASPAPATTTSNIEVTDAWVRTVSGMDSMGGSSATALFMNIHNNSDSSDMLLKAEGDIAKMIQIHLSEVDANGVSSMHEVDGVEIPAGGMAELKPGGYHVMLMDLNRELKEGDTVTITLTFKNAGTLTIEAPVKTP